MRKRNEKEYKLELAAERLLDAVRRKFFEIPRNKMDKIFVLFDHAIWALFTIKIIGYWMGVK